MRGFPRHLFYGVHVRSFVCPHGVIRELSGQIGYTWCHIGAYFPPVAMEMIIPSQIYYSFHYLVERYCICLSGHYSCAFSSRWAFSGARGPSFDHPTSQDYSVICYVETVICLLPDYTLRLYQIIRSGWRWILPAKHYELEKFGLLRHFDRPRDFVKRVMRLCSPLTGSFRLANGASFETRRVPFSHLHWMEGCGGKLHWGIFPLHRFLVV